MALTPMNRRITLTPHKSRNTYTSCVSVACLSTFRDISHFRVSRWRNRHNPRGPGVGTRAQVIHGPCEHDLPLTLPGFVYVEECPLISYSTYRALLSSGLRSNVNPHVYTPVLNVPEQRFVTLLALSFLWQWRFRTSVGDHDLPVSLRKNSQSARGMADCAHPTRDIEVKVSCHKCHSTRPSQSRSPPQHESSLSPELRCVSLGSGCCDRGAGRSCRRAWVRTVAISSSVAEGILLKTI
jgi:hypothetical protein